MTPHRLAAVALLASCALAQLPVQDRPPCTSRLPFPAGSAPGAVAGGKAFFAIGPDVLVYEEASGAWSVEAGVLSEQGASAVTAVGDRVFFAGGFRVDSGVPVPDGLVHVHDATSGAWTTEALSVPRLGLAAASTATHVYFAGGEEPSSRYSAVVDVYEVATGTWSTTSLSQERTGLSGAAVGALVLFAGGYFRPQPGPAVASDVVDVLDTSTGTWSTASLSQPRWSMASAAAGGRALFAGGLAPSAPSPISDRVDVFDLASGSWSTASLPTARYQMSSATVGTRSFFIGGLAGPGGLLGRGSADVDEYDAATGRWAHAHLSEPALFPGTAGLTDRVLVAGGYRWTPGFLQPSLSSVVDVLPASLPRGFCEGGAGCPCANAGSGGGGCGNSVGGGARLSAQRCPLVDDQRPRFRAEALPKGELAILFTGTSALGGGGGAFFGDGLRCVGGSVRRLAATQSGDDGGVDLSWLPAALVDWSPGDRRLFQLYYRDPSGPCGQGFNTSQGIEIEF